jgi:HK97 family phage major capsid protein
MRTRLTTPAFMVALLVGIVSMGLSVYAINERQVGTLDVGHRATRPAATVTTPAALTWLERWRLSPVGGDERGFVAVDLLTPVAGIKAVQQRAADLVTAMKDIRGKLADPKLTDVQRAELKADFTQLEQLADTNGEDLAAERRLQERERGLQPVTDPDEAAARAAAAAANPKDKKVDGFNSFGERLQAVRMAALPGGRVDQRLLAIAPGMNESNPSDGGFLVGQEQVTTVRQRMYDTGQILSRVFNLPLGANSNGVKLMAVDETSRADGARYGGITSYWLDEGGTKTASKPKWRPMELSLKKVAALVRVTDELLADAVALEAWIMKFLPLELKFKAEDAIMSGTGAGMPLGFLNSGAAAVVTRTTPGTVSYEDIVSMYSRFYGPSLSNAASAWFVDQSALPALFSMSLQIGAGGIPVFLPANGITGKPYSTLFGLPVIPAEYLSALGTKGDVVLADLSQYTFIDKGEVQAASSIHVYFVTDETAFRFVYRCDGQPEWSAPLTPKNGGPTVSPIVVLAT